MAKFNREQPYEHAYGIVQDHEPFFFQDGCAFTHEGAEVFKDEMGNFSLSAPMAEPAPEPKSRPAPKQKPAFAVEKAEAPESASEEDLI